MWSLMQHLWPFWRAANSLSPFPLPFAPSTLDVRRWNVELIPAGTALSTPLPADGRLNVSLHRLLIESGIALTLATTPWDPRSWFALYRYGADFAGTQPTLRFYSGVQHKDPRLTAVASEEVATGITCYILREYFGLDHIADALACIQQGELVYSNPLLGIRPDYLCEDANHEVVIAESKGSTGTRSSISGRIDPEGISQVQNVAPVNLTLRNSCNRVVIGTHFCVQGSHPRSETTTVIRDPDGPQGDKLNPESDMVLRLAYAKVLRFVGQDAFAESLIYRRDLVSLLSNINESDLPTTNGTPFLPLGISPFQDIIGLYWPTATALVLGSATSIRAAVMDSLKGFRDRRLALEGSGYGLSNGVILAHDFDLGT